jgi:hypothetical protein
VTLGNPFLSRTKEDVMNDLYSYRSGVTAAPTTDLTGFDVEATDGSIGKIDEATNETSASSLVVDTGFWIFGKKRMIPAGVVRSVDLDDQKVYVSMSKDDIKNAPDYDPDLHRRDAGRYRDEQGQYYSRYTS